MRQTDRQTDRKSGGSGDRWIVTTQISVVTLKWAAGSAGSQIPTDSDRFRPIPADSGHLLFVTYRLGLLATSETEDEAGAR